MRLLSVRVSESTTSLPAPNYLLYKPSDLGEVENVENYVAKGLHPVSLGDTLAGGRYKIIHKLGFGGSSTVWLARDQQHVASQRNLVALKVMSADLSHRPLEATQEIIIPQRLQAFLSSSRHPAFDNIHFVADHFTETGPNGTHLCIVSHLCGPNILSTNEYLGFHYKKRIRGKLVRRLAKQAAIVIEGMHRSGIVHGDMTTSNILFKLTDDIQTWTDSRLFMELGEPVREEIVTSSGLPPEPRAPRELVEAIDCSRFMESSIIRDSIVLTDFGQSFCVDAMPNDHVPATVIHYSPPEIRFDSSICLASDVWMRARAIYEIRAGDSLFDSFLQSDSLVWMQIVETSGKLPDPWWNKFDARHIWFDSNGEPRPHDVQAKDDVLIIAKKSTIKEKVQRIWGTDEPAEGDGRLTEGRGMQLDDVEVSLLTDLLEKMLRYRLEDRITMAEVIQHPWFDYQYDVISSR